MGYQGRRDGMPFKFDKRQAEAPVKVSWRIKAVTVAQLEVIAKSEGVGPADVAQQMLDHVLGERRGKGQS
jgi:hypothetical protein